MLEKYKNGPFITYTLFAIQVVVFLLEYLLPVKQLGSMYGPLVAYLHEYWRFVTPIFIHYGLMHIVFNSVVLYYMGQQLEAIYGHWRFLFQRNYWRLSFENCTFFLSLKIEQ